ncbi:MAG: hypothetical protein D6677_08760 [Calditrichaeota bacterium]|nr:MAG: hypothetical protein D6677_08760 [Calditrichota bacterium]
MNVTIATRKETDLVTFLEMNEFETEQLAENILRVRRHEELPVYVSFNGDSLYFEVDLGNISAIADQDLYFKLLDLNTEVLPVSFGINNSHPEDPRLVLVESRETDDLSDQELLAVFDALELAVDRAEALLQPLLNG